MRTAFALFALAGCRSILGIEDTTVDVPSDTSSVPKDIGVDAIPDGALTGCPAGYQPLPNAGPRNHRYRLITIAQPWAVQRAACASDPGFLAFPDGTAAPSELAALTMLANSAWLGLDDRASEGAYQTSLNQPASPSTTALISSGGPGNRDCIMGSTSSMTDEDCGVQHQAICECVP